MSQTNCTVGEFVEKTVAEMRSRASGLRGRSKRRMERRAQRLENRFEKDPDWVAQKVVDELSFEPAFKAALPALCDQCDDDLSTIGADTPFMIDVDKLRELIDLFIEKAPQIIEIIMKIVSLFSVMGIAITPALYSQIVAVAVAIV